MILMMIANGGLIDLSIHDNRVLWAALVVAVFALLRAGEFLKTKHKLLAMGDLTWQQEGNSARLTLHNTKTMVWDEDLFAYLYRNQSSACPVSALHAMIDGWPEELSKGDTDPLFRLSSGKPLTRNIFVPWLQELLVLLGLPGGEFNGVSTRKGGAQSLRLAGAPNDVIRLMGRWAESSFVFETYQAVSARELAACASRMASLSFEELSKQRKGHLMYGAFDTNGIFHEEEVQDFVATTTSKPDFVVPKRGRHRRPAVARVPFI